MNVIGLKLGPLQTNCYIVSNGLGTCAVIDPGADASVILNRLYAEGLRCDAVFLTHGHRDHFSALPELFDAFNPSVYISVKDLELALEKGLPDLRDSGRMFHYGEGDVVTVSGLCFSVLTTPGHTNGSVTLICGDAMFTGDALFHAGSGRTDLKSGNRRAQTLSLRRLWMTEKDYELYPGHGLYSTLSWEKKYNQPMLEAMGLD